MVLIYASVELTIIAAASGCADHGLPGVRGILRTQQILSLHKTALLPFLHYPQFSLESLNGLHVGGYIKKESIKTSAHIRQ
jgi:hypothetical protein